MSKNARAAQVYRNLANAPPSYEQFGAIKPIRKGRNDNTPLPIRFILCQKCIQPGGTLVNRAGKYYHADCLEDRRKNK